jgi:hypothetical protein
LLDSYGFTPAAVLDPSLNSAVRVVTAVEGDTYALIQQLAGAELAVAGGDEAGNFRFYNRETLQSIASVRDVTSATSLRRLGEMRQSVASVVNHATVDYAGWALVDGDRLLYEAPAPIRIPGGQTIVLTPTLDAPSVLFGNVESAALQVLPDGSSADGFWLRCSTTKAGTAAFNPNLISRTVRQIAANRLAITLTNLGGTDCWLVSSAGYLDVPAGTPLLRISGQVWGQSGAGTADVQYPPVAADGSGGAASSRFGDQVHQISGNPWIQDFASATLLAQDIVRDQYAPRPDLTGVEIVPDPRLQLTDVIRLRDPDGTLLDEYARIFGWKITWSTDEYTMTLDARTLAAPGGWIMGVAGRSEIGSTAYVYP